MERKMQLNIIYRSKDEDDDAVEYRIYFLPTQQ